MPVSMENLLFLKRNFHVLIYESNEIYMLPSDEYEARKRLQRSIDLLAIQQKGLDRALFLHIFIHEIRSSGVRASITIVHIRKFYKM